MKQGFSFKCLKRLFEAIVSALELCSSLFVCSVIVGEFESSRVYQGYLFIYRQRLVIAEIVADPFIDT